MTPAPEPGFVSLSGRPRLARGAVRDVYAHPDRDDRLIKTLRTRKREAFENRTGPLAALRRRATLGLSTGFLREYRAYLRTVHRASERGCAVPLAMVCEVVRTDRGPGQVVEKVTDGEGGLAVRLRALRAREGGLDAAQVAALNAFVALVYRLGVNAPDIGSNNIVWDGAAGRFVLIDGFGEQTLVPFREWLPVLNRRRIDARLAAMGQGDGLRWDARARRFERV